MDEILFLDMIIHYNNRIKQLKDELDSEKRLLLEIETTAIDGWTGDAADAFIEKIRETELFFKQAENAFEEVSRNLSVIQQKNTEQE